MKESAITPQKEAVYVVLDNIRSVHNVGSIFRTADAAGVAKLYLVGCTPTPIDRFGRTRKDLAKVALGAERSVPFECYKTIAPLFRSLRNQKVFLVAVEQDKRSIDYQTFNRNGAVAFVFGNEVSGLSRKILDVCDAIVEIPMRGRKESLNVSVSAGIVLFQHTGIAQRGSFKSTSAAANSFERQ